MLQIVENANFVSSTNHQCVCVDMFVLFYYFLLNILCLIQSMHYCMLQMFFHLSLTILCMLDLLNPRTFVFIYFFCFFIFFCVCVRFVVWFFLFGVFSFVFRFVLLFIFFVSKFYFFQQLLYVVVSPNDRMHYVLLYFV